MTLRTCPALLRAALAGLVLSACGGDAKEAKAEAKAFNRHACTITLARKAEQHVGKASGEDEKLTEEAAWTDVCARLPEADRPACRDEAKFAVMKTTSSGTSDGKTNYTVTLTVAAKHPSHEGRGQSETAKDEACKIALEQACTAAGEPGDCLASGKFEKQGQSTSSQRVGP